MHKHKSVCYAAAAAATAAKITISKFWQRSNENYDSIHVVEVECLCRAHIKCIVWNLKLPKKKWNQHFKKDRWRPKSNRLSWMTKWTHFNWQIWWTFMHSNFKLPLNTFVDWYHAEITHWTECFWNYNRIAFYRFSNECFY